MYTLLKKLSLVVLFQKREMLIIFSFFVLISKNENVSNFYLVKKDNIEDELIDKLFEILKRYKKGENKEGEFPRNNNQEMILNTIDKFLTIFYGDDYYKNSKNKKPKSISRDRFKKLHLPSLY